MNWNLKLGITSTMICLAVGFTQEKSITTINFKLNQETYSIISNTENFEIDTFLNSEILKKETTRVIRHYDVNENVIESYQYRFNILERHVKLNYNTQGKPIKVYVYDAENNLTEKQQYEHDEKSNETNQYTYNPDGSFKWQSHFKYDEQDNMIEMYLYNADGNIDNLLQFKYDQQGNRIESHLYFSFDNYLLKKSEYIYDEQGNMIKYYSYNPDGSLNIEIKCQHISKNQLNQITLCMHNYKNINLESEYMMTTSETIYK